LVGIQQTEEENVDETLFNSYQIPVVHEESTLVEPLPIAITENESVTFSIINASTERGSSTLIDSRGYSYTIKRKTSVATSWRCSIRNAKINC
jgi:hypothetical protein